MIQERTLTPRAGLPVLLLQVPALIAGVLACFISAANIRDDFMTGVLVITGFVLIISLILTLVGFTAVSPNQSRVVQLFGKYTGTIHEQGLWWVNPFTTRSRVSVRVRNFDSDKLKVNDKEGNPIEIGAVVVWKVVETAEAVFEVDDYEDYVCVQSEAALRNLATRYPYDAHDGESVALRSHAQQVAEQLKVEVQERLDKAGVEVLEARISHLAYAQEIASAMLQRQQADAIIAARQKIVDGAVGMVEMAITKLNENDVVELDEERKAQMVSNLLVVLCGDKSTQPVVNTGSVY
jgi:regulator of protease activity HflC (stomatin/prohibitin superfamily)